MIFLEYVVQIRSDLVRQAWQLRSYQQWTMAAAAVEWTVYEGADGGGLVKAGMDFVLLPHCMLKKKQGATLRGALLLFLDPAA